MSIFNYFHKQSWCEKINTTYLRDQEEKLYKTYTTLELEKLLTKPDVKKCSFAHFRSWAMVNFLYATGVRVRTLIHIKNEDLDLNENLVKLKVMKNKKQMVLPITKALHGILEEYIYYRGGSPTDYLFCNKQGNQFTIDAVRGAILRYNERKGVNTEGSHRFRHTFATDYIRNGGGIIDLQHLLGHSSLDITQNYVNLLITDLKEHNNTFNPLDNFLQKQKKTETISMKKK